jgi:hypothetical protein
MHKMQATIYNIIIQVAYALKRVAQEPTFVPLVSSLALRATLVPFLALILIARTADREGALIAGDKNVAGGRNANGVTANLADLAIHTLHWLSLHHKQDDNNTVSRHPNRITQLDGASMSTHRYRLKKWFAWLLAPIQSRDLDAVDGNISQSTETDRSLVATGTGAMFRYGKLREDQIHQRRHAATLKGYSELRLPCQHRDRRKKDAALDLDLGIHPLPLHRFPHISRLQHNPIPQRY